MTNQKPQHTHNQRRLRYSLNITIAVIAALAIIVIINIIASRQVVRLDYSATREHTLTTQSQNAIDSLKQNYTITALINKPKPNSLEADQITKILDLLELYQNQSDKIKTNHIYLSDSQKRDRFLESISQNFSQDQNLAALKSQIKQTTLALSQIAPKLPPFQELVTQTLKNPNLRHHQLRSALQNATIALHEIQNLNSKTLELADKEIHNPLPNLTLIKQNLLALILGYQEQNTTPIAYYPQLMKLKAFTKPLASRIDDAQLSANLTKITNQVDQIIGTLTPLAQSLQQTLPNKTYDQFIFDIKSGQTVVIEQDQKIQTIPLSKIFLQPEKQADQSIANYQINSIGEELITGNLIKLSLKHHPRLVFVSTTGKHPLEPNPTEKQTRPKPFQSYTYIANRLKNLSYEITHWFPIHTAKGSPKKFAPPPPAQPNQKTIYILLPLPEDYHTRRSTTLGVEKTMAYLQDRVAHGDSAMLMLRTRPGFTAPHPAAAWLKDYGISLSSDAAILRENLAAPINKRAEIFMVKNHWNKDNPIAKSLHGSVGFFINNFPIHIDEKSTSAKPLIKLTSEKNQGKLWAETDLTGQINKPSPDKISPSFTHGAFVESQKQRIIITAADTWASDLIAGNTDPGLETAYAAFNDQYPRAYPANTTLFINSIYWLANLDQLIGSTPKAHAIHRIDQVDEQTIQSLRYTLVIALPLITLIIGALVYFKRHRH